MSGRLGRREAGLGARLAIELHVLLRLAARGEHHPVEVPRLEAVQAAIDEVVGVLQIGEHPARHQVDAPVARVAQEGLAAGRLLGLPDDVVADVPLDRHVELARRRLEPQLLELAGVEQAERARRDERRELVEHLRGRLAAHQIARRGGGRRSASAAWSRAWPWRRSWPPRPRHEVDPDRRLLVAVAALEVDGVVVVLVVDVGDVLLGRVDDRHRAGRVLRLALPGEVRRQEAEGRQAPLDRRRAAGHDVAPCVAAGGPGAGRGRRCSRGSCGGAARVTTTPAAEHQRRAQEDRPVEPDHVLLARVRDRARRPRSRSMPGEGLVAHQPVRRRRAASSWLAATRQRLVVEAVGVGEHEHAGVLLDRGGGHLPGAALLAGVELEVAVLVGERRVVRLDRRVDGDAALGGRAWR